MTAEPQCWLPDCALTGLPTLAPIAACAAEWSAAWLGRDRLEPDLTWSAEDIEDDLVPQASRPGFALFTRAEERLRLASLLLGRPIEPRHLRTDHDRALVERLVDRAIGDLADHIARSLPQSSNGKTSPQSNFAFSAAFRLSNGGRDILRIGTHRRFLVELAKHNAPPARARRSLDTRSSAIALQTVDLSSLVGCASLNYHELEGLEVGDVITLDDRADARRHLFVAGRPVGDCVAIAANDDRLSLIIEKAANAW